MYKQYKQKILYVIPASENNYLLFREPTDFLAAVLYYQYETQFVASESTSLEQPEI